MSSSLAPTSEELQRASSASASASAASSSHRRRVHWSPFLVHSHQRLSEHLSHLNKVFRAWEPLQFKFKTLIDKVDIRPPNRTKDPIDSTSFSLFISLSIAGQAA
ncbi:hypothetical protein TYRP_005983 [Tyrophagus putrescentiae]|nr:hypothetical protein TYRP_005983 [Tyrophagus putrescentiae]